MTHELHEAADRGTWRLESRDAFANEQLSGLGGSAVAQPVGHECLARLGSPVGCYDLLPDGCAGSQCRWTVNGKHGITRIVGEHGFECGGVLANYANVEEGDTMEVYETRQVERTLS